jgi:hypothetical protein
MQAVTQEKAVGKDDLVVDLGLMLPEQVRALVRRRFTIFLHIRVEVRADDREWLDRSCIRVPREEALRWLDSLDRFNAVLLERQLTPRTVHVRRSTHCLFFG